MSYKRYHDAFTDLSRLDNHLLSCFRLAKDQHSNDGTVVLKRRNLQGKLILHNEFKLFSSRVVVMKNKIIAMGN